MDIVKRERYVQKIIRLTPTENIYIKNKIPNCKMKLATSGKKFSH
jgi:hypothetical protein